MTTTITISETRPTNEGTKTVQVRIQDTQNTPGALRDLCRRNIEAEFNAHNPKPKPGDLIVTSKLDLNQPVITYLVRYVTHNAICATSVDKKQRFHTFPHGKYLVLDAQLKQLLQELTTNQQTPSRGNLP